MYELPYSPIEGVRFQPWVGETYATRNPRLLIVGMSHYSWNDDQMPDYFATNAVIIDRINGDAGGQFFTNIIATCLGRLPSDDEREPFWRSVAFYNYIQEFVGDAPRHVHTYVMWQRSHGAFSAVIRTLKPQLILVVGIMNWNNMSNLDGKRGELLDGAPEARYAETWSYPTGEGDALAFHVKHTSAGYNYRRFAPLFEAATHRHMVLSRGC